MDILKELNEPQKEAVLHKDGPLLVVAGAGAGKTKVITHRIANLIQNEVKTSQILAVTFTNKAANEMKERVRDLITTSPAIGTFHSICARILRENGRVVGLPSSFSILDKEDSLKIVRNCLKTLEINPKQFQPKKMLSIISKQKSNLITLEEYTEDAGIDYFPKTVASVWEEYEKSLQRQKSADFDDLISKTVYLFRNRPEILEKYQDRWQYILVDEYQDTNHSQYIFTKLLAQKNKNICVVGDEDQSIYSFRGADFGNILNFEEDWPNAKVVMLEQNYRSTQKILDAANAVIQKNKMRKPKNLFSKLDSGQGLIIYDASNEKEEAEFIARVTKKLSTQSFQPKDIAVLYRANFQSRVIEESFIANDVPYQVVGTRFFERKEVKDVIAYLKSALNLNDLISLERIINEPPRGLGKSSLLSHLSGKTLSTDRQKKILSFFKFLAEVKQKALGGTLASTLIYIIKESGYQKHLSDGSEEGMMRIDNLKELITLSTKYSKMEPQEGIEKFLEDVSLISDQDSIKNSKNSKGFVRLMTIHAAKGLEFPCVFVTGLEDGLFPYEKPGEFNEEEERRLFYVALTRAREKLHLSFSHSRMVFGGKQLNRPSRFLNEIPIELFDQGLDDVSTTNYLEF
ncbi:ATP-dependent helicase [Patescibacteria group bacterium]